MFPNCDESAFDVGGEERLSVHFVYPQGIGVVSLHVEPRQSGCFLPLVCQHSTERSPDEIEDLLRARDALDQPEFGLSLEQMNGRIGSITSTWSPVPIAKTSLLVKSCSLFLITGNLSL